MLTGVTRRAQQASPKICSAATPPGRFLREGVDYLWANTRWEEVLPQWANTNVWEEVLNRANTSLPGLDVCANGPTPF